MKYEIKKVFCSKRFENETILITDPCYPTFRGVKDKDAFWGEFCTKFHRISDSGRYGFIEHDGDEIMVSDTLYGDWSCHTFEGTLDDVGRKNKKVLGQFCADAGLVCVVSELLCDDYYKTSWTTTKIENFTGEVKIVLVSFDGDEDEVCVVGTGSVNFYTVQTGF